MLSDYENCSLDVLETDMTEETSPENRIFIRVMVNRLRRILGWDPGNDEVLFDKSRGPDFMRDILEHFVRWKTFACDPHSLVDSVGAQHLVIYSMAKLCFFYWIRDSEIVADVLRHVYSCDGHFSSMFAHIINAPTRTTMWPLSNPEAQEVTCCEFNKSYILLLNTLKQVSLVIDCFYIPEGFSFQISYQSILFILNLGQA